MSGDEKRAAHSFLPVSAPNVAQRLEALEQQNQEMSQKMAYLQDHADRVEEFLFIDRDDKPSMATVMARADNHFRVLCDYAKVVRGTLKWVAYIGTAMGAVIAVINVLPL